MNIKKGDVVKLRNGILCDVVHQSRFGKWLLVERTTDELPLTHWHNNNGTFWAEQDEDSQLDVIKVIASPAQGGLPVVDLYKV